MRRLLWAAALASMLALPAAAKSPFVFFSDDVPRHEGLGFGAFFNNQYAIGGWRDYAVANVGIGAAAEYTLPRFLPINLDFGATLHLDMGGTVPKKNSTLDSRSDIRLSVGGWVRIPFTAWGQRFAFQPEFAWGIDANNVRGKNGSKAEGWYTDQIFMLAPALRWTPPGEKLEKLEIDFSPIWSFGPERHGNVVNELGFRLGAVYHFDLFSMGKGVRTKAEREREKARKAEEERKKAEAEEAKRKQAEEEARLRAEEEARRKAEQEAAEAEAARLKAEEEARLKAEEEARLKAEQEAAEINAQNQAEAEAQAAIEKAAIIEAKKEAFTQAVAKPEFMLGVDAASLKDFTPDGDGINDTISFSPTTSYLTEPAESWTMKILDSNGGEFRTWSGKGNPPAQIVWDGKSEKGDLAFSQSVYTAELEVEPSAADKEILGMDKARASVEGKVEIDTGIVMEPVAKDEWRITMTTFRFDPNEATFNKLDAAGKKELEETLEKLVKKFNSVDGAHVTVEGYANNISGTREENEKDLLPLSQKRAETLERLLIEKGFAAERITAVGMGDKNPIASREDRANWWKNRRTEFHVARRAEESAAPVEVAPEATPEATTEEAANENE